MSFTATWMELEIIMLSEVSQTEKDKYHMILLIGGIQKKKSTNELIYRNKLRKEVMVAGSKDVRKGQLGSLEWTGTHCYI